jgi:hypothetical protein
MRPTDKTRLLRELSSAARGGPPSRHRNATPLLTAPASISRSPKRSSPRSNTAARLGCSPEATSRPRSACRRTPPGSRLQRHQCADPQIACIERGFDTQSWPTFRKALKAAGHVRKGEKGTTLVYADRFIPYRERTHATRLELPLTIDRKTRNPRS